MKNNMFKKKFFVASLLVLLLGFVINIGTTLNNPFSSLNMQALAQTSGGSSGSSSSSGYVDCDGGDNCPEECAIWHIVVYFENGVPSYACRMGGSFCC